MAELIEQPRTRIARYLVNECGQTIEDSFDIADALIPMAQLPWDEPTEEEIDNAGRRGIESALREFVRRRNAALQPKPVDPRKPYCCFIGCQNPPTWQVDAHVGLEDDTQSCDDHLGHLLTDAPLHTVCPIRPVDPRVDEIALIICQSRDAGVSIQQTAAKIAALQPDPVDPRREKIIAALDKQYLNGESSKIADAILAALDGAK